MASNGPSSTAHRKKNFCAPPGEDVRRGFLVLIEPRSGASVSGAERFNVMNADGRPAGNAVVVRLTLGGKRI